MKNIRWLLACIMLLLIGLSPCALTQSSDERIKAFMKEEIGFTSCLFPQGNFPAAAWKRPDTVAALVGNADLNITWFNQSFQRVATAKQPGRYGALIEGKTADGFKIQRVATVYSLPVEYAQWLEALRSQIHGAMDEKPAHILSPQNMEHWNEFQLLEIARFLADTSRKNMANDAEAAVFFAGLREMKDSRGKNDTPRLRDRQWWIDFKRIVLGYSPHPRKLAKPLRDKKSAKRILTPLDPDVDGFRPDDMAAIRAICAEWADKTAEPNVTLIALHGSVFFHEAFGMDASGAKVTLQTPMWMASITKLMTGALMMQFIDQGFVDPDKNVSCYLPEVPEEGEPPLRVRDLFTHTAGFQWHDEWASDWNMTLENYLAHCRSVCKVREKLKYNRMGYAVAGKIMERLTGRAVPTLFNEYLLKPLGMSHTYVDNTYGSCQATAWDIALLGQMLLQKGSAGSRRFFSEQSFNRMLPQSIEGPDGRLKPDWGIGTVWLEGHGWSPRTFGHEAASGALLRIDPESGMVLVQARDRTGEKYLVYEAYRNRLLAAAAAAVAHKEGKKR